MDRWLLRMARWARNPPSPGRVRLVLIVVAICLAVVLLEQVFGFPEELVPAKTRWR
ncbi:hypothetical protein [Pseudooceanicola nanhaiensis]|uniref:hypothetical protein n=1 Tax=Pseudooceanicola nanhaiensis TaxID=375761 RepID=UPI001CD4B500|nr:hypothetical protein [Pseudooceanicola nanhaiensis]MCA0921617.1 hypothetical protein [Pseudooceanicola nanhaiensis]